MAPDKPVRRMTLRQLLTHAEKCTRELMELIHTDMLARLSDFRDLTRPVRRRSNYPTMLAVQNALRRLEKSSEEARVMIDYLHEHLEAIRGHAEREKAART